jgi:hypothetical protein
MNRNPRVPPHLASRCRRACRRREGALGFGVQDSVVPLALRLRSCDGTPGSAGHVRRGPLPTPSCGTKIGHGRRHPVPGHEPLSEPSMRDRCGSHVSRHRNPGVQPERRPCGRASDPLHRGTKARPSERAYTAQASPCWRSWESRVCRRGPHLGGSRLRRRPERRPRLRLATPAARRRCYPAAVIAPC